MASRSKWIFFVLTSYVGILVLFLAIRGKMYKTSPKASSGIVHIATFTHNFAGQDSYLQIPETYVRPEVDDKQTEYNFSTKVSGSAAHGSKNEVVHQQTKEHKTVSGKQVYSTTQMKYFQPIDNKEAWLYSAFYDHVAAEQGRPLVRLFGMTDIHFFLKIYCNFSHKNTNLTSIGRLKPLPDSHSRRVPASYAECYLPNNTRPTHVSISFNKTDNTTNRLQIQYSGPRIRNFTVCYAVLHSNFNMSSQLIESIEMNRILGAEHFMVYNYSISSNIDQILRRYQQDGLVTVLQWPLPSLDTHSFAQGAVINDCMYRNRKTSRFVVVVDTDELIIPRNHFNWMELIHAASPQETDVSKFISSSQPTKKGKVKTDCFVFISSHFFKDKTPEWDKLPKQFPFTEEEKKIILNNQILTLSQFWRKGRKFNQNVRSKYIARPEIVFNAGIHYVHSFVYFSKCMPISDNLALVNHYRVSHKHTGIVDTRLLYYKNVLYPMILKQFTKFPKMFKLNGS